MSIKFAFQKFKYKSLSVYEAPTVELTNMFFVVHLLFISIPFALLHIQLYEKIKY